MHLSTAPENANQDVNEILHLNAASDTKFIFTCHTSTRQWFRPTECLTFECEWWRLQCDAFSCCELAIVVVFAVFKSYFTTFDKELKSQIGYLYRSYELNLMRSPLRQQIKSPLNLARWDEKNWTNKRKPKQSRRTIKLEWKYQSWRETTQK